MMYLSARSAFLTLQQVFGQFSVLLDFFQRNFFQKKFPQKFCQDFVMKGRWFAKFGHIYVIVSLKTSGSIPKYSQLIFSIYKLERHWNPLHSYDDSEDNPFQKLKWQPWDDLVDIVDKDLNSNRL